MASDRTPETAEALARQAEALRRLGRPADAVLMLDRLLQLLPGNESAIEDWARLFDKA